MRLPPQCPATRPGVALSAAAAETSRPLPAREVPEGSASRGIPPPTRGSVSPSLRADLQSPLRALLCLRPGAGQKSTAYSAGGEVAICHLLRGQQAAPMAVYSSSVGRLAPLTMEVSGEGRKRETLSDRGGCAPASARTGSDHPRASQPMGVVVI